MRRDAVLAIGFGLGVVFACGLVAMTFHLGPIAYVYPRAPYVGGAC